MPVRLDHPPTVIASPHFGIGFVALLALLVGMQINGPARASDELVVVAARMLRPGTVIQPSDLAFGQGAIAEGFARVDELVGLEARVMLYPERPIRPDDVAPPAVVLRNQIVTLRYSRVGLSILTEGRSLGRASEGEPVRVLNLSSRNTVTGRARAGGVVDIDPEIIR